MKGSRRVKSRPSPIGSSVLFRFGDRHFLVSAAHVFKRFDFNTVGLFFDNDMYYLDGTLKLSNPNLYEKDKIDVAVVELTPSFVKSLPSFFEFYDFASFYIDHVDSNAMRYLAVGTPFTRFKLKLDIQKVHNTPFIFLTHRIDSASILQKLEVDDSSHILLEYTRKRVQASNYPNYITGPSLNGMSGCGIWIIANFVSTSNFNDIRFYPTGILTEYEPNYCSIVATRIRVVSEILRQSFDVGLPKSKLLDLRFTTNKITDQQLSRMHSGN